MKHLFYIILIITAFCSLEACESHKERTNLGSGYILLDGVEIFHDTMNFHASVIVKLNETSKRYSPIIFPNVKKHQTNTAYIIVKQQYISTRTIDFLEAVVFFDETFESNEILIGLDELCIHLNTHNQEECIENYLSHNPYFQELRSREFNYFIIDKTTDQLYGPLNEDEFMQKKDSLGIELKF